MISQAAPNVCVLPVNAKTIVRGVEDQGTLLIWNNLNAEGEPNTNTLHQGMPVLAGVKYVITKWYRERPWGVNRWRGSRRDDR